MKITVMAVGKMRDRCFRELAKEYRGRLAHHLALDEKEVSRAKGASAAQVMQKEAANLLGATPEGAVTVAMTEEGKSLSSPEVAQRMQQWMLEGRQEVVFYIGGAHGLDRNLRRNCDQRWSLSRMTFPHEMARMLLWEQLYRAMTIIRGEPYHK